jgi:hypothetical protein
MQRKSADMCGSLAALLLHLLWHRLITVWCTACRKLLVAFCKICPAMYHFVAGLL